MMFLLHGIWNTIVIYIELLGISHRVLNGNNLSNFAIRLQINENNGSEVRDITNLSRSDIRIKSATFNPLSKHISICIRTERIKAVA